MRYLDPKADILFKKVFGEQKGIMKAFLNAMLPLEDTPPAVDDTQIIE